MSKLETIIQHFEKLWPLASAEDWDKPGLLLGSVNQDVSKVLLTVDVTSEVVSEAVAIGANLIFAHHPLFLKGVHELSEGGFRGRLAAELIRNNIALYAAHTNADGAENGVSDMLAKKLGLMKLKPLDEKTGHGRIGELPEPQTLLDYSRTIARTLPAVASGIKVAGDPVTKVQKIAVLGGAGDSYLSIAKSSGADLFITSDLRHHPAQEFIEQSKIDGARPSLIDISHWAAEWVWLDNLAATLAGEFKQIEFVVCDVKTDPWNFAVMQ